MPDIVPTPRGTGLTIRPVMRGDFERLSRFVNAQRREGARAPAPHVPASLRERVEGNDRHAFRLIALRAEEIIGEASLTFGFAPQPDSGRLSIAVREDQRRRGVGTALLAELFKIADERLALRCIELMVLADNAGAIRLYQNMGFETAARIRHRDRDGFDSFAMIRSVKQNAQKLAEDLASF